MTIHFLDIDLDAFLDDTVHYPFSKRRPAVRRFPVWSETRLVDFLEGACGLSKQRRVPGRYATEHDAALTYLEQVTQQGAVQADLIHLDGHADLGIGLLCFADVLGQHLHKPPAARMNPVRSDRTCNPASWLLYAVAGRLCTSVVNAYAPGGGGDIPYPYFLNSNPVTNAMQLRAFTQLYLRETATSNQFDYSVANAVSVEPSVPFTSMPIASFSTARPFDYAFVCQSPVYTPKAADRLIPVLERYIDFDAASQPRP